MDKASSASEPPHRHQSSVLLILVSTGLKVRELAACQLTRDITYIWHHFFPNGVTVRVSGQGGEFVVTNRGPKNPVPVRDWADFL